MRERNYLLGKLMDWFLYDNGLRHERVNQLISVQCSISEPTENVSSGFLTFSEGTEIENRCEIDSLINNYKP